MRPRDSAPQARDTTDARPGMFAGFWRQVLALCIDYAVLGIPAYLLALRFIGPLLRVGARGRLIEAAVAYPNG